MSEIIVTICLIVGAYLLGSINSSIIISRIFKLPDPRSLGSGNPGATNVLRTGNKLAAAITLLGDLLKGFIPVIVADYWAGESWVVFATGLATLLGHMYPIYNQLKGGKGVATTLGVLLGFDWLLGLIWAALWLFIAFVFRYSSVAALISTLLTLISTWLFFKEPFLPSVLTVITLLLFWRHRSNLANLFAGKESKIGKKSSD